jgi:hypothetical protein
MKQQIINNILQAPNSQLSNLIAKVNQLHQLNQSLSKILDPKLTAHCQITSLENETLTLLVDNSSWGTKIRYMSPDIIEKMQQIPTLYQIKHLKCIVRPNKQHNRSKNKQLEQKLTISDENAQLLRSIANNIKDKKLKEALIQLADHGEKQ